ncbi:hypothetical protein LPTSP3_g38580 [Leptospira kobayashii]|uniref:Lipoprotein n=1 Tax=Leptospira kobayashii TaxID=1917830 RepID=A0ABM7UPA2_9LEPT|nr:hypothetical protein [Leptospira kobayashii]BDA80928.1 hypothetical protein LPTSP3_g38580 [Leptospira kobayashii]
MKLLIRFPVIAASFLFFLIMCKSSQLSEVSGRINDPKENRNDSGKFTAKPITKLRLTYDSVWSPKKDFVLLESGSLHESGNSYKIEYQDVKAGEIAWIKVSSTNQDNQRSFPYLNSDLPSTNATKVYYFSWQGRKASILMKDISSPVKVYLRWEGIYKGYLIVAETEMDQITTDEKNGLGDYFHQHVSNYLELF